MRTLKSSLRFEWKGLFTRKNVIVMLLLLVIALYFCQGGIYRYKHIVDAGKEFQEVEISKVESYFSYTYYGVAGLRILFLQCPLYIFFYNSAGITELTSHIDSGDVLDIDSSMEGKNLFIHNKLGFRYTDFSGILILLGSLLSLLLGYESFKHLKFQKSLNCLANPFRTYLPVILARALLLLVFLAVTLVCAFFLIMLNGISFTPFLHHYFSYFAVLNGVILFFYALGAVMGARRLKNYVFLKCAGLWFVFAILIPVIINSVIEKKAEKLESQYRVELAKLNQLMGFEKRALDEGGKLDLSKKNSDITKKIIESYWCKEFKRIQQIDKAYEKAMRKISQLYHRYSLFFLSTFYLSSTSEISSAGYESALDFYRYSRKLKQEYVRYYLDKKFYTNEEKVENFINCDENVYMSSGKLSPYFGWGLAWTYLVTLLLFVWGYFRFKKALYSLELERKKTRKRKKRSKPGKPGAVKEVQPVQPPEIPELNLAAGQYRVLESIRSNQSFPAVLYNLFSGRISEAVKSRYNGKIRFEGKDITTSPIALQLNQSFVYLCHPDNIPGEIITGNLVKLFNDFLQAAIKSGAKEAKTGTLIEKLRESDLLDIDEILEEKFGDLEDIEKFEIMVTFAELYNARIYLFDHILHDMPVKAYLRLKQVMEKLSEGGSLVVNIVGDVLVIPSGEPKTSEYSEHKRWSKIVDGYQDIKTTG
ncbi:MAG: hypothetical protein GTO45_28665 [Candidatus Aminicenantes bacterium]|nr:hypothetical protein [Candidatus Aminicenantes bacterium]NIM82772.1 hypothetical protein [Candidatus Aminicenantes bacterium]NIN22147.1 hypothetical protein [Candidatus Aminicenantes bacterium]NIN45904.1 hypothetical protein [Candidatus Aminicenantes bacterium]NIN88743.1 hypothetical protein [Candidatus Aminicenantes bacterium]